MTTEEFIDQILTTEGGFVNDPSDHGGATNHGITAQSWGNYKNFGRPATVAEVKAITKAEAQEFYRVRYINASPFAAVAYEPLRLQLIDMAINSGSTRATRWLQRCLDVPVTGTIDDRTKMALTRDRSAIVNKALIGARLVMYQRIVAADDTQKKFIYGWCRRAVSFWDGE